MKTNSLPIAPSTQKSAKLAAWLTSENHLLSSVMEEPVTNKQFLMIANVFIPFCILLFACLISLFATLLCAAWFVTALVACANINTNKK